MMKSLKPGTDARRTIKLNLNRLVFIYLVLTLVTGLAGCTGAYVSAADLTATALSGGATFPALITDTPILIIPSKTATQAAISPDTPIPTITPTQPLMDTPVDSPTMTPSTSDTPTPPIIYYTQSGDTLPALAARFNVAVSEISSNDNLPETSLIKPGTLLVIPERLGEATSPSTIALPDSEIVYSPSALDLDVEQFVAEAGGCLSTYKQYLGNGGWTTGAQVVERVALENSINPRLLLSLLEYQNNWVYGQPGNLAATDYPLGYVNSETKGLYAQLAWAVQQLSIGYYGWRAGILTELPFSDGSRLRISPVLNGGTAALQYLFAQLQPPERMAGIMFGEASLPALHEQMFGSPWLRAQNVEPLYPPSLTQPTLQLPFAMGQTWSLTGGPHSAWGKDGALAALDFAPPANKIGCNISENWVTAVSDGLVVRSVFGVVVVDMDGDGYEQTGWAILYLHMAADGRIPVGTLVSVNDKIGHPSCEGGASTGSHLHIARKYNGEWILADGPLPFTMGGYVAHAGIKPYLGTLTYGDQTVTANQYGSAESLIYRPIDGP